MATTGKLIIELQKHGIGPRQRFALRPEDRGWTNHAQVAVGGERIVIDEVGVGGGIVDRLKEQDYRVTPYKGGRSPKRSTFANLRAESHWHLRTLLEQGQIALPHDEELFDELVAIRWRATSNGKIQIEPKEHLKNRLGRSPDRADAVVLAFSAWTEGVGLIIFDSLARLWRVTDENDAVQTGQAVDLVLQFTRSVDAASWLIAHHRKAGSADSVDLLRGSSATPATIDIITALRKRSGGGRKIDFDSRYDETPQEGIVIDIGTDGRYNVLGDERSAKQEELRQRVLEVLGTELLITQELAEAINEAQTTVRRALDDLYGDDKIGRSGDGKRGSPCRFRRPDLYSTTLDIGAGGKKDEAAS